MKTVYDIYFKNSKDKTDKTQLVAESSDEVLELIASLREEMDIKDVDKIEKVGSIRYYVCGIGYDDDNCVTDFADEYGDFDTYEEAKRRYDNAQTYEPQDLFDGAPRNIEYIKIQLEECEDTKYGIECYDILAETDIYRDTRAPIHPWDAPGMSFHDFI